MGTIVVLFALQGDAITSQPWNVVRIALPRPCCFAIMFAPGTFSSRAARLGYARSATVAFTAAGNNFELWPSARSGSPQARRSPGWWAR